MAKSSYSRKLAYGFAILVWIATGVGSAAQNRGAKEYGISSSPMSRAEFESWMQSLSNWGRWGKDDERGTLNLIDAAKRSQAVALAKDGIAVSLSRDVQNLPEFPYNGLKIENHSSSVTRDETITFRYHGLEHTHLDGLSHMLYNNKMYNGYEATSGANKLGISNVKNAIVTRGVLIDIPALRGVPYLTPGEVIRCEELDLWLKKAKLKVRPGDAVFIRTGRWAFRKAHGAGASPERDWAGLDLSCAQWLKDHDVALLGNDFANELSNEQVQKYWLDHAPFHILAIVSMGMYLIDNCDLELLAAEAFKRKRWEFLLVVSPISIPQATGSPVNPVAIF